MPPPQPIVEAPIPNIPFVRKLPAERFFSENKNKDTFTIDEVRTVIHGSRTVNNGRTEKSYYDKADAIMTKFELDRKIGLWSDAYEKGFDEIIEVLSVYKNPSGYIVVLLYIYERSDKLKAIVDKQDKTKELLKKLQEEYKDSQDREKVANRATKKADNTNYIQHYKDCLLLKMSLLTRNTQVESILSV
jgi:hypothetical protein